MRYYNIVLRDSSGKQVRRWTSHPNGVNAQPDPGALNVEMDLYVISYATPVQDCWVRLWGVSLQDIAQANNYGPTDNFQTLFSLDIYGGMGKGLPLANPNQGGLLVSGFIWQCFANWQGTEMSIDFIVKPSGATHDAPRNLCFMWEKGTPLSQALQTTLSNAYPGVKLNINISPKLITSYDQPAIYGTLETLAYVVQKTTNGLLGTNYPGVTITIQQGQIYVFDVTAAKTTKQIVFTDLVGQPTWIDALTIQIKTIMRADILVGDNIQLPQGLTGAPGQVIQTPQSLSILRNTTTFQGAFLVTMVRTVGDFRQADGSSWVTIITAVPLSTVTVS